MTWLWVMFISLTNESFLIVPFVFLSISPTVRGERCRERRRGEPQREAAGLLCGRLSCLCVPASPLSSASCTDGSVPVIDGTILLWCSRFNGA